MEEYGRIATEEIHRQWSKGKLIAEYNGYYYRMPLSFIVSKLKSIVWTNSIS